MQHEKIMNHLLGMPSCALIATGRTGTDFLQSLFDSHPEVLTFNGALFFYSFWEGSTSIKADCFNMNDLITEFYGKHIELFKTKYDLVERKNQLGDQFDQSIEIDLVEFGDTAVRLLENREPNSKNILLAIYAAYAMCLGQDILQKKLFFHHAHHFQALDPFLKDFPNSKVICMTRDPRANFVSSIENWRKHFPSTDNGNHLYHFAKRILIDSTAMEIFDNDYRVVRVEDLDRKCIFDKFCQWLNIRYDESLEKSTWAGMLWLGDSLSSKNLDGGRSRNILKNKWEEKLSSSDKRIFNYIFNNRLKHYGYSYKEINFIDSILVFFLILLPLSYEARFFSFSYLKDVLKQKEYKKIFNNIIFFWPRIFLFLKYYFKTLCGKSFSQPILKCNE